MADQQMVFLEEVLAQISTIPGWLFLMVACLIIALLQAYDLFTSGITNINCSILLMLLLLRIYSVLFDTSGNSSVFETPAYPTENHTKSSQQGNMVMKNSLRRRLAGGITTKSTAVLEHYGWGKFIYELESPHGLNPLWLTFTDGATYRNPEKTPVILMWTTQLHRNSSVAMVNGSWFMDRLHCPVTNCVYTDDRSKYMAADVVVFFQMEYHPESHRPLQRRLPHKRYVFFNRESPVQHYIRHVTNNKTFIQGFYNWTATYRLDSDIHVPYVVFHKRITTGKDKAKNVVMKGKKKGVKMVAWFVSHCKTSLRREDYVAELSKYVPVDVWGKCGKHKCGRNQTSKKCYKLLNDYWFYLSFENALCNDYVTEKVLFAMLYADVIPIVYGLANYSKQLPPHSVLNSMDFTSSRELSQYIIRLTEDSDKYVEYLMWKKHYSAVYAPNPVCQLCKKLNEKHQQGQVYMDFTAWWNKDQCDPNWLQRNKLNW